MIFPFKLQKYSSNTEMLLSVTYPVFSSLWYLIDLIQFWTKYLRTFSRFSTISPQNKRNGARLLSPASECTSCLTRCRITEDFRNQEFSRKKLKCLELMVNTKPAKLPKRYFLTVLQGNCKKSAVKHSMRKPNLLNSVNLSTIASPRLWVDLYVYQIN